MMQQIIATKSTTRFEHKYVSFCPIKNCYLGHVILQGDISARFACKIGFRDKVVSFVGTLIESHVSINEETLKFLS